MNETTTTEFNFFDVTSTSLYTSINDDAAALFAPFYIYGMIISGTIGFFVVAAMGIHSIYHMIKNELNSLFVRFLYIMFFSSYSLTCFAYGFLRTNILFPMGEAINCRFGLFVTTNSVYSSKMFIFFLFLLRIDLAFHQSALGYPRWFLIMLAVTVWILTTVGNIYYMYSGWNHVAQFPLSDYDTSPIPLKFCAYSDPDSVSLAIFGLSALDFVSFSFCCGLFIFKLFKVVGMTKNSSHSNKLHPSRAETERSNKLLRVIKKQTILVLMAVISTFILMGSAGTVGGGISLLISVDAVINTFCVWLMFAFADPVWNKLLHCCCFCCFCSCCGKKEDYLMTLRSITTRRYSLKKLGSITNTADATGTIKTQSNEHKEDIEINFDNDIKPDDLNANTQKLKITTATTTTVTETKTTTKTTTIKKELIDEQSIDSPNEISNEETPYIALTKKGSASDDLNNKGKNNIGIELVEEK